MTSEREGINRRAAHYPSSAMIPFRMLHFSLPKTTPRIIYSFPVSSQQLSSSSFKFGRPFSKELLLPILLLTPLRALVRRIGNDAGNIGSNYSAKSFKQTISRKCVANTNKCQQMSGKTSHLREDGEKNATEYRKWINMKARERKSKVQSAYTRTGVRQKGIPRRIQQHKQTAQATNILID